jgi:transposase-like protein
VVVIWWVTAVTSPRKRGHLIEEAISITTPVINCPACSTPNPVESQVRPLRFACVGCQRVIRIEA